MVTMALPAATQADVPVMHSTLPTNGGGRGRSSGGCHPHGTHSVHGATSRGSTVWDRDIEGQRGHPHGGPLMRKPGAARGYLEPTVGCGSTEQRSGDLGLTSAQVNRPTESEGPSLHS